jgi:hypothetical protein
MQSYETMFEKMNKILRIWSFKNVSMIFWNSINSCLNGRYHLWNEMDC